MQLRAIWWICLSYIKYYYMSWFFLLSTGHSKLNAEKHYSLTEAMAASSLDPSIPLQLLQRHMAMGLFQRPRSGTLTSYKLFRFLVYFCFVTCTAVVSYRDKVEYNYCKQTNRVLSGWLFGVTTKGFVKIMEFIGVRWFFIFYFLFLFFLSNG